MPREDADRAIQALAELEQARAVLTDILDWWDKAKDARIGVDINRIRQLLEGEDDG